MNRSQHKQAVVALFLLGLISLSIVFVYASTIDLSAQLMKKRSIARADESLDLAVHALSDYVNTEATKSAEQIYSSLLAETNSDDLKVLGMGKKTSFFKKYLGEIKNCFGKSENINSKLALGLVKDEYGVLKISDACSPELVIDFDEANSEISKCVLKDVVIQYYLSNELIKEKKCDIKIDEPEAAFNDESIDFLDYCLLAMKGIYFTGDTSTIVGNIYAGTHTYEEGREAEVAFGERGPYGGVNFLTTQVGVYGDSIVSTGDINLKGAFVLFGSEDDQISMFANTLNEIENYPSKTKYEIYGNKYFRDGSVEFMNEEHYKEIVDTMEGISDKISDISSSYYSKDDSSYNGAYEKIITSYDVTLNEDFTGVVVTKGSVLVEADCNVEGMIIAGDRIYSYGNNNIVSNKDLVKEMAWEESLMEPSEFENGHCVSEYIDGILLM